MYITLKSFSENRKVFNVRIWMEDIPNRLAAVSHAELRCTCEAFSQTKDCTHVHQADTLFRRWLSAQTRKLQKQAVGNQPISMIQETITVALGAPLSACQIFEFPDGRFAVQKPSGTAHCYSRGCGWGTGGKEVQIFDTWPMVGMLHVLKLEPDFALSSFEFEQFFLFPASPLPLPPAVSPTALNLASAAERVKGMANGLFDLFEEEEPDDVHESAAESEWAKFWCASFGFRLQTQNVTGGGPYLPGYTINGEPVGAIALDLAKGTLKLIPSSEAGVLVENIPAEYRAILGHTHLPWGRDTEETVGYQVLVKHPSLNRIVQDEPLEVLTTNLWAFPALEERWPDALYELFAQIAEIMIRMGHDRLALLYHAGDSMLLGDLADSAQISETGGSFAVSAAAWEIMRDEIVPAINKGLAWVNEGLNTSELGPDWPLLNPPKESSWR